MDKEADPAGLLQREGRPPERKKRDQNEPFGRGGERGPRQRQQKDRKRMQIGSPSAEQAEEHHGPGDIRQLMEQDPGDIAAP